MNPEKFRAIVQDIILNDRRYTEEAYYFVNEAVAFASEFCQKPQFGSGRHLAAEELLDAMCEFSRNEFGTMAVVVLNNWGILTTLDWGHVIFNLIDAEILSASPEDRLGDFNEVFDLKKELSAPFLAQNATSQAFKKIDSEEGK